MSASRWAILVPLFSVSLGCTAANFFVMQGDDMDAGAVGEQRSEPPIPDGATDDSGVVGSDADTQPAVISVDAPSDGGRVPGCVLDGCDDRRLCCVGFCVDGGCL